MTRKLSYGVRKEDLEGIISWQRKRQRSFSSIPDCGTLADYLNRKFIVYRNAFIPCEDSHALAQNMKIRKGESVLDLCSGVGVIGLNAKLMGAGRVVCADINPNAVRSIRSNIELHGLDGIEARLSDVFSNVPKERFDVITINPPFMNKQATNLVEAAMWDSNLETHKKFFSDVSNHLKTEGRIYFAQSNFGAVGEMKDLAEETGFSVKKIGEKQMPNSLQGIFYAFELRYK